jgi:hypothetical protein
MMMMMYVRVCLLRLWESGKNALCIVFSFFFFSLSLASRSLSILSFVVRTQPEDILIEKVEKKKKKKKKKGRDISIQQKHNNDDAVAAYQPARPTQSSFAERKKGEEKKTRASMNELAHTSAPEEERKEKA